MFFKLKKEVCLEHQDHWFTYPAGLAVRLDFVDERVKYNWFSGSNEDGEFVDCEKVGVEEVHHFVTSDGYCYVFDMENLDPATEEEFNTSLVRVVIE